MTHNSRSIIRILEDFLDEIEGCDDPSFTSRQVDLIERRLAEIRFAIEDLVAMRSPSEGDRP